MPEERAEQFLAGAGFFLTPVLFDQRNSVEEMMEGVLELSDIPRLAGIPFFVLNSGQMNNYPVINCHD